MRTSGTMFLTIALGAMINAYAGTPTCDSTEAADSTCQKRKPTRSYFLFQTGVVQVDPGKFNDKLSNLGYTGFDSYTFNAALGGHKEYKRFISEDQFSASWWRRNDNNNIETSLMTFNLNSTMGFNILPSNFGLNLFPYAGFGIGMNRLRVHQEKATMSEALSPVITEKVFRQGLVMFNGGIGSDFVVPSKSGTCGFTIGIRGGYQIPLYISKWYSNRTSITDLPDLKQQGFYVRFAVGGWGKDDKKCEKKCCDYSK